MTVRIFFEGGVEVTDSGKRKCGALLACFLFFFCRLTVRVVSFIHSAVAADVLYRDGMLPGFLLGARAVMTWLSVLTVVVSCSVLVRRISEKSVSGMVWGFTLICFADGAAVFLIDLLSGAFQETFLTVMGLVLVTGTFLVECAFVWLVYCIAARSAAPEKSVLWACGVHMLGRLAMEVVYLIQFLIEVDFAPYKNEVWSIVRSFGGIVLWQGIALWLASVLVCRLIRLLCNCVKNGVFHR